MTILMHQLAALAALPAPPGGKLDAGLIGEISTCHNRRCSRSCNGSRSSRGPSLGYAQEFNFAAGNVTAIV